MSKVNTPSFKQSIIDGYKDWSRKEVKQKRDSRNGTFSREVNIDSAYSLVPFEPEIMSKPRNIKVGTDKPLPNYIGAKGVKDKQHSYHDIAAAVRLPSTTSVVKAALKTPDVVIRVRRGDVKVSNRIKKDRKKIRQAERISEMSRLGMNREEYDRYLLVIAKGKKGEW